MLNRIGCIINLLLLSNISRSILGSNSAVLKCPALAVFVRDEIEVLTMCEDS